MEGEELIVYIGIWLLLFGKALRDLNSANKKRRIEEDENE